MVLQCRKWNKIFLNCSKVCSIFLRFYVRVRALWRGTSFFFFSSFHFNWCHCWTVSRKIKFFFNCLFLRSIVINPCQDALQIGEMHCIGAEMKWNDYNFALISFYLFWSQMLLTCKNVRPYDAWTEVLFRLKEWCKQFGIGRVVWGPVKLPLIISRD